MQPITALVIWMTQTPGASDNVMIAVYEDDETEHHVVFSIKDPVTFDGVEIHSVAQLSACLEAEDCVDVTFTPSLTKFAFSTRTDFTSRQRP